MDLERSATYPYGLLGKARKGFPQVRMANFEHQSQPYALTSVVDLQSHLVPAHRLNVAVSQ
jgi:hypothetical protein